MGRNMSMALCVAGLFACSAEPAEDETMSPGVSSAGKPVIYQLMTRLYGNKVETNKAWGTIEDNGVGKFADITDAALASIRELGVTHVWFTGVPHHAVIRDYTEYGIANDDPDVVKGRAGSPYAVKDYYSVNPDLAVDPAQRLEEFVALIERTHRHGMRVVIDIVPNHVARRYHSLGKPDGIVDFGADDDTSVEWARNNDFYYVVGEAFQVPESRNGYRPLGGEAHPLVDGQFDESPAKWTGNGARLARPDANDWYETVKINYGVRPDGSYAFDRLPDDYRQRDTAAHAAFWQSRDVPPSWQKFRDITRYWLDLGVDGFRFDMAEMVPVEFWSYLNASIKAHQADAILIAEVYQPQLYRDYIQLGRMDYLYDKVGFYDTLRPIMSGAGSTDELHPVHDQVRDIAPHMLHFLENHDEQRIASPEFAGDARAGMPGMVVSALISPSPIMLYFGQEVGEPGAGDAGFGTASRTTIFDYWGVPAHQRWMNGGRFDGGRSSDDERALRDFYASLLRFVADSSAVAGEYLELHSLNRGSTADYDDRLFSFARWSESERLIVVSNFSADRTYAPDLELPPSLQQRWRLESGSYTYRDVLSDAVATLVVADGRAAFTGLALRPYESMILRAEDNNENE